MCVFNERFSLPERLEALQDAMSEDPIMKDLLKLHPAEAWPFES